MFDSPTERTRSRARDEEGFTLIELLIVVVIIGILAAIAIPQFSSTKEKAVVAKMKSDLHNVATAQEVYFADSTTYADTISKLSTFSPSVDVTLVIDEATGTGWAAHATAEGTSQRCDIMTGDASDPTGGPTLTSDQTGSVVCE